MTEPGLSAGISQLDDAYGKRLAGEKEAAARTAIALLEADAQQLGAAALLSKLLIDANRPLVPGEVASRLVDASIRRGDLPAAVSAVSIARLAKEDLKPLLTNIAKSFGKGSPRLGQVSPSPPPVPPKTATPQTLVALSGDNLWDRAEQCLTKFLSLPDAAPEDAKVPSWPLFSALAPNVLAALLNTVTLREFKTGDEVIRQSEEGNDAFVVVRGALEVFRKERGRNKTTLAALGPGAIFGEMALVSQAPRAASVVALEPVELLTIGRHELEAVAKVEPAIASELARFCRHRMLGNLLRHSELLAAVPTEEREHVLAQFQTCTYDEGHVLLQYGAESPGLYLIASGTVQVIGRDNDGHRIRMAELGPGDVVGEVSLVLRKPSTVDVISAHPTVVLYLARERFQETIRAFPELLSELYNIAARRDEEMRTVVAQQSLEAQDWVLV